MTINRLLLFVMDLCILNNFLLACPDFPAIIYQNDQNHLMQASRINGENNGR